MTIGLKLGMMRQNGEWKKGDGTLNQSLLDSHLKLTASMQVTYEKCMWGSGQEVPPSYLGLTLQRGSDRSRKTVLSIVEQHALPQQQWSKKFLDGHHQFLMALALAACAFMHTISSLYSVLCL